jgi:pathogenesis-related protein 1
MPRFCHLAALIGGKPRAGGASPKERRIKASRALRLLIILLLVAAPAHGQSVSLLVARELLGAHNAARVRVGSPPLVWSDELAGDAERCVDQLIATHTFTRQPENPHGENLFLVAGGTASPVEVVRSWLAEMGEYDHNTNRCVGVCGHYTQAIWRTTRAIGCAVAFDGYRQIWVCEYEPPGNIVGQHPY